VCNSTVHTREVDLLQTFVNTTPTLQCTWHIAVLTGIFGHIQLCDCRSLVIEKKSKTLWNDDLFKVDENILKLDLRNTSCFPLRPVSLQNDMFRHTTCSCLFVHNGESAYARRLVKMGLTDEVVEANCE
jgi:hypothetical protein